MRLLVGIIVRKHWVMILVLVLVLSVLVVVGIATALRHVCRIVYWRTHIHIKHIYS